MLSVEGSLLWKNYKIAGGYPLKGTIRVSGAKNSAVALIPATILADSPVTIEGLPDIRMYKC